MTAACGQRFNAFDGPQRCGRQKGHRGAHTRDPLPRERAVMEAGEKAKAEARQAASELRSAACVHWYVMVQGGMRCKKCGAKL